MVAAIKPVPSLSPQGMLTSVSEKLDAMLAHFHASDINQDHLHAGTISNLSNIVKEAGHDIPRFKNELRRVLETYLGRLFEAVVVEVDDDTDVNFSNRVNVSYAAMVTQQGQRHDVSYQLTLVDGKFEKITKLNNTGRIH